MCDTCGCGTTDGIKILKPGEDTHGHTHTHIGPDGKLYVHSHTHDHKEGTHHEDAGSHEHSHDHDHGDGHSHAHIHTGPEGPYTHSHAHSHSDGLAHDHDDAHDHSHDHSHPHTHDHSHGHAHSHDHGGTIEQRTLDLHVDIMGKNDLQAERNRGWFEAKNIFTLNLVSSPGSGKTSLLERTLKDLGSEIPFSVIEGDQQTTNDADRINALKVPVVQINTGNGCHLDADMIYRAKDSLEIRDNSILMIENVGNLVCPSLFDLGEDIRVVIISVTEGEDKPIKYPTMFETAQICIINKIDLLPYLDFDVAKCREYALRVNPDLEFFELSVRSGEGMDAWYTWLKDRSAK